MKLIKFLILLSILNINIYCAQPQVTKVEIREEVICLALIKAIINYENAIQSRHLITDSDCVDLLKKQYDENKELSKSHNYLKIHYLGFIRTLKKNENSYVIDFLAHYADDELLDELIEDTI